MKSISSLHGLRALSQVKFRPEKFAISTQAEKNCCHVSFNSGQNEYFFTSCYRGLKSYLQRFAVYFTKLFNGKSMFRMQLQDYFKAMTLQKQLSRGVLRKRCSENMQQIYRRTPMPKSNFNKVVLLSRAHLLKYTTERKEIFF